LLTQTGTQLTKKEMPMSRCWSGRASHWKAEHGCYTRLKHQGKEVVDEVRYLWVCILIILGSNFRKFWEATSHNLNIYLCIEDIYTPRLVEASK
jgi:hypothetical protein